MPLESLHVPNFLSCPVSCPTANRKTHVRNHDHMNTTDLIFIQFHMSHIPHAKSCKRIPTYTAFFLPLYRYWTCVGSFVTMAGLWHVTFQNKRRQFVAASTISCEIKSIYRKIRGKNLFPENPRKQKIRGNLFLEESVEIRGTQMPVKDPSGPNTCHHVVIQMLAGLESVRRTRHVSTDCARQQPTPCI